MKNNTVFTFPSVTQLEADSGHHQDIYVFLSVVVFWVHNFNCCLLKQLDMLITHVTEVLQSGSSQLF